MSTSTPTTRKTATQQPPQPSEVPKADGGGVKETCIIPGCGQEAHRVIALQAAPGVEIDSPVCIEHFESLEQAKRDSEVVAQEESNVIAPVFTPTDESPYGDCHMCGQPLGVLASVSELELMDAKGDVVVKWWYHLANPKLQCHADCRCSQREIDGHARLRAVVNISN